MIITLSGNPGAGKSTVAQRVAAALGYQHYSVGDLRGKMAEERGMTIAELNKLGETTDETDKQADAYQKKLGETEDDFIIDARLGFHFIPHSYKIFLDVDERVGAERIFNAPDERPDEPREASVEDVLRRNKERMASDNKRYEQYYGLHIQDRTHYDAVIDTTHMSIDAAVKQILEKVRAKS